MNQLFLFQLMATEFYCEQVFKAGALKVSKIYHDQVKSSRNFTHGNSVNQRGSSLLIFVYFFPVLHALHRFQRIPLSTDRTAGIWYHNLKAHFQASAAFAFSFFFFLHPFLLCFSFSGEVILVAGSTIFPRENKNRTKD